MDFCEGATPLASAGSPPDDEAQKVGSLPDRSGGRDAIIRGRIGWVSGFAKDRVFLGPRFDVVQFMRRCIVEPPGSPGLLPTVWG